MASAESTGRLEYQPALDGLRGVAVAAVIAFHLGAGWAIGGFLGVSAFFTLSGFLITSLLLAEHDAEGRIALRSFWIRRLRRLQPAALLTLAGVLLFAYTVAKSSEIAAIRADVLSSLGEVANWHFIASGRSYTSLFAAPSPVQHFWSLAIEEQFYLVLPLLIVGLLALPGRRRWLLPAVVVVLTVLSTWRLGALAHPGDTARAYYGTDSRAAELLVGVLLALFVHRIPRIGLRRVMAVAGAVACVALVWMWTTVAQTDGWLYHYGLAFHAVLIAVVIVAVTRPTPLQRVFSVGALVALGEVSYGVYLAHWPIFLWLDEQRTGLDGVALAVVRLAATAVVAIVSYRLLERPVRTRQRLLGWHGGAAAAGAIACVLIALVALTPPTRSAVAIPASAYGDVQPARRIVNTSAQVLYVGMAPPAPAVTVTVPAPDPPTTARATTSSLATTTTPPPPPRPVRILVVGDSVAASLSVGIDDWGAQSGLAESENQGRVYCGIGRGGEINFNGAPRPQSAGCDDWPTRWKATMDDFQPDVIVVLTTIWDVEGHKQPGWDDFLAVGDPRYDAWITSEFEAAADLLASSGSRVVWLKPPCEGGDQPETDGRLKYLGDAILPQVARAKPFVQLVDLRSRLCPGGKFSDVINGVSDARPDGLHFSEAGATATAELLANALLGRE